jgi:ferric-dicitrate binding protein FerR (iron transport regulator)
MALSLPGLNADLIASLKSGDLTGLEKLFRAVYPALLAKAKETLGDDVAASRVVERLIPRLFADRASLTTPDELNAYLDGAVHDAAVRERSRLAGIRKHDDGGKKSAAAAPSADEVWRRIAVTVQGPSAAEREAASQMKEKLRHEAAGHIKQATKERPLWVSLGAGALILAVVVGSFYFFQKSGEVGRLGRQVNSVDARELKTGTGQRGNVTLDDGTTAKFGADTKVRVPGKFGELVRGVGLDGAAEFTVAQNPTPFQVLAKNVQITALGTVFAVNSYANSPHVIVRVREGSVKVEVQEPEESEHTLTAGQTLLITPDGKTSTPDENQLAVALGYLDDQFVLPSMSLKATLAEIKRWYGTDLFLKDTTLNSRMIDSLRAPLSSSADAIKAIEVASGLVADWEGQTRILRERVGGK